jgi:hypothetical protein
LRDSQPPGQGACATWEAIRQACRSLPQIWGVCVEGGRPKLATGHAAVCRRIERREGRSRAREGERHGLEPGEVDVEVARLGLHMGSAPFAHGRWVLSDRDARWRFIPRLRAAGRAIRRGDQEAICPGARDRHANGAASAGPGGEGAALPSSAAEAAIAASMPKRPHIKYRSDVPAGRAAPRNRRRKMGGHPRKELVAKY